MKDLSLISRLRAQACLLRCLENRARLVSLVFLFAPLFSLLFTIITFFFLSTTFFEHLLSRQCFPLTIASSFSDYHSPQQPSHSTTSLPTTIFFEYLLLEPTFSPTATFVREVDRPAHHPSCHQPSLHPQALCLLAIDSSSTQDK